MDPLLGLAIFFLGAATGALLTRIAPNGLQQAKSYREASAYFVRLGE